MFSSKVPSVLRNIVSKTPHNNGNSIALSNRLLSTEVSQTDSPKQEYVPDKLYKLIEVEVRGNDKAVLTSYGQFACTAANHLQIECIMNQALRKPIHERMTLLKSAHIYKKHRVQYEMRTYFRYLKFAKLTGSTVDTFLEYLQRNLPEGVAMKVAKTELNRLPETVTQASACNE